MEYDSPEQLWLGLRGVLLEEADNRPERIELDDSDFDAWLETRKTVQRYLLQQLQGRSTVLGSLNRLSEDILNKVSTIKWIRAKKGEPFVLLHQLLACLRLLQEIHNRTRFHRGREKESIQSHLAEALSMTGEYLATTEWIDLAELALLKAHELGGIAAGTHLALLVLRGDVERLEDYPPERLVDLLWPGVLEELSESLICMALVLALYSGTPEDWYLADALMERMSRAKRGALSELVEETVSEQIFQMWYDLADDGELCGYLALVWMVRHGFAPDGIDIGLTGIAEMEVRMHLPHAPFWLFETE